MTNIIKNKTILLAAIKNKFAVCNLQFAICISLLTANCSRTYKFFLLTLLFAINLCAGPTFSFAQPVWSQTYNPSDRSEGAYAITADDNSIYVAGYDAFVSASDWRWHIEKRNKSDGALDGTFDGDGIVTSDPSTGTDWVYAITVDASSIYIAGRQWVSGASDYQWRIEKRDKSTGALDATFGTAGSVTVNPSTGTDIPLAITIAADGSGLFIAGYDNSGGDDRWRIEKRNLTDGTYITAFDTDGYIILDPSTASDRAHAIISDASGLFVTGYYNVSGDNRWRIEKRNLTDGTYITAFDTDGWLFFNGSGNDQPHAIAIDATGIYVAGQEMSSDIRWQIRKYNSTSGGSPVWFQSSDPSTDWDVPYSIAVDGNGVYIAGYDNSPGATNSQWRMEQRNLSNGTLICSAISNPSTRSDIARAITTSGSEIYVAGDDYAPSIPSVNIQWRIEKYPGVPPCALPIELLSFSGSCSPSPAIPEMKGVVLQWSTASEQNNDYFTIEKGTRDEWQETGEIQWKEIGTVKGAGNSSTSRHYEFTDQLGTWDLGLGTWYYRLQQTDYDGKYEYFGPISVNLNNCDENTINIFPNPSSGMFNVQWSMVRQNDGLSQSGANGNTSTINHSAFQDGIRLSADQPLTIEVYNVLGEKVFTSTINPARTTARLTTFGQVQSGGHQPLIIDISSHPDGIYFLRIKTEKEIITRKIIKKPT